MLSILSLAALATLCCTGSARAQAPSSAAGEQSTTSASTPGPSAKTSSTPWVEPIVSMRDPAANTLARTPHKSSYDLSLDTSSQWTDTGITVAEGEQVIVDAKGSSTLSDGRSCAPAGLDRRWKDLLRQLPAPGARTCELIGRVSDLEASIPFAIGATGTVPMPTTGRLFLRSNVSPDLTSTGTYTVHLRFAKAETLPRSAPPALPLSSFLRPAVFDPIPRRVVDEAGHPGDMVNFALLGSEAQVKSAFASAGWVAVDKSIGDAVLHGLLSTLGRQAYTEMPMSTLFLFDRPQDLSFARADPLLVAAERHHLRLWKTSETPGGASLWVGSATHDIGFERDQRNGKTTHRIDPNVDLEREFLLKSFDATAAFTAAAWVTPEHPLRDARTATGGSFVSDGRILVMQLK